MADRDKRKLEILERQVGTRWGNRGGGKGTGECGNTSIWRLLGCMIMESRKIEKKLVFAGRVVSLEAEGWAWTGVRGRWRRRTKDYLPMAGKVKHQQERRVYSLPPRRHKGLPTNGRQGEAPAGEVGL